MIAPTALDLALDARDRGIVDMVRDAIRHRQVLLAYQPVVRARDPATIAFHEALIRVLDGNRGCGCRSTCRPAPSAIAHGRAR